MPTPSLPLWPSFPSTLPTHKACNACQLRGHQPPCYPGWANACVMCHMYTHPWPNRAGRTQQAKAHILPWPLLVQVTLNKSFYFSGHQFPQQQNGKTGVCFRKMGRNKYVKYLVQCLAHVRSITYSLSKQLVSLCPLLALGQALVICRFDIAPAFEDTQTSRGIREQNL